MVVTLEREWRFACGKGVTKIVPKSRSWSKVSSPCGLNFGVQQTLVKQLISLPCSCKHIKTSIVQEHKIIIYDRDWGNCTIFVSILFAHLSDFRGILFLKSVNNFMHFSQILWLYKVMWRWVCTLTKYWNIVLDTCVVMGKVVWCYFFSFPRLCPFPWYVNWYHCR